jgi:N-acetylglucosamine-6-phosphate deacetylase
VTLTIGGGRLVTPGGVRQETLTVDGARIVGIAPPGAAPDIDARGGWIVPGFIDLQINGAHGIDVTTQPERIGALAAVLPRYGVTAFLPTVITCPSAQRAAALAWFADRPTTAGAVPLGLHLEGPMLAPARHGAHPPEHLADPAAAIIDGWEPGRGVALATLAPERPGALPVITTLAERGVVVSIGHTDCTAAEFAAGRDAGARYVTHLFNAMRPFGHRDPGPIGAALADEDVVVGLICDGIHVDPVAVRMAWHVLGPRRLSLVTDAVAALGTTSGQLGAASGAVRNAAGVLAGSVLSLDQAVRNLVAFTGCAVPDAVATVTSTPADLLGLADRGRLATGARADVTVLDPDLAVVATVIGGEVAWRS